MSKPITGNLILGLVLFVSAFTSGCADISSSQVSPSAIYSSYGAHYDEASNKIRFSATYTVGGALGTYVQLDSKSSVTLDGNSMTMSRDIFDQIFYEYDLSPATQALAQSHQFVYTDDSGRAYINTVSMPGLVVFQPNQNTNASIGSSSSGFAVSWVLADTTSGSLGANDQIEFQIQGAQKGILRSISPGGASGQIYISAAELQSVGLGTASMSICHQTSSGSIQGTSEGGDISLTTCSTPLYITISH